MLKINKKVEYALIVLKHFETMPKDTLITARMVCEKYKTPFDTTSRVMQIMNQKSILRSSQGVNGGYLLNINLLDINYLQLTEMIEGKNLNHNCSDLKCSLISTCNITKPIIRLNDLLNNFFKNLSIKELLTENPALDNVFTTKAINE